MIILVWMLWKENGRRRQMENIALHEKH